ncbi:ABC transporter ATP-binding protein [Haloimpatiens sp. FM7330]|uniref:ABC transporter ATP-binding protein n=1 Tax=Haloimpatiens sp. FM7330 TaxID=3298610 RepID=UPI0036283F4A
MEEILRVEDVSYEYNSMNEKVMAVKKVNACFEKGKVYAITGSSGSGKTTLLSLLAGLDKVKNGDIFFKENSLKKLDRDKYRSNDIGIVFQSFNLLPQLTAAENVMISLELCKWPSNERKIRAMQLLKKVGLNEDKAKRRVLKLSGGEQQRVAIARALSSNPELILADEPTGNLDSRTGDIITKILTDLAHKENKCIIIVTHSNTLAKKADEVYGMKDGVLHPIRVNVGYED